MIYKIRVYEIREYTVDYIIDAKDADEAIEKACLGETESETNAQLQFIKDRDVCEVLEINADLD